MSMQDHFYTTDAAGELAPWVGYSLEGITGYVFLSPQPDTVPVYRFFHPSTGDHFYCRDSNGELGPQLGYQKKGDVVWYMYEGQKPGTAAVNRWWKPNDHFYTTDPSGELAPMLGYSCEGVLGYICTSQQPNTTALYRWYHGVNYELHGVTLRTSCFNLDTQQMRISELDLDKCVAINGGELAPEIAVGGAPDTWGTLIHSKKMSQYLADGNCELKLEAGPRLHLRFESQGRFGKEVYDSFYDLGSRLRRARDGHVEFVHPNLMDTFPSWIRPFFDAQRDVVNDIMKAGPGFIAAAYIRAVNLLQNMTQVKDLKPALKVWFADIYFYDGHFVRRGT